MKFVLTVWGVLLVGGDWLWADAATDLFESRIRPVLVERCFECHTEKAKGGLRLDSRRNLLAGGDSGSAIVPGEPRKSLLIQALHYGADSFQMPPKGKLPASVIQDFERWINEGVVWPVGDTSTDTAVEARRVFRITAEDRSFWSFQPLVAPVVPMLADDDWSRNLIDRFVISRLRNVGLSPSDRADKRRLIRRATFDLTGLPPSPEEIDAFLKDPRSDAYDRLIERLLASPRYGEHAARHWLDGVRYASDVGYYNFSDLGWRYRDWVIRAMNADLPYDDFVEHQIAGDLLPDPEGRSIYPDGVIATGVLAMGNYDDQESDKEKLYAEVVDDQIDLVGRQFLGLTLACARCHDHKFDPISTADYYALAGIFMSSQVLESNNRIAAHRLKIPVETPEQLKAYEESRRQIKALEKRMRAFPEEEKSSAAAETVAARIRTLRSTIPSHGGMAIGAQDGGYTNSRHAKVGDMRLYLRGNPYRLGPVVPRRIPELFGGTGRSSIAEQTTGSGRLELARWIADKENPLTARVIVNRIWQQHFGRGLVRTANNFGKVGEPPSHPELLDYLAADFVRSGWSLKRLHRLIMSSATYQQSSHASVAARERDPENRWLGRYRPRRLRAEELGDALLAVSGALQAGVGQGKGNRVIYRRIGHLYSDLLSGLFDVPPTGTMVAQRTSATTAPQSLFMLNDRAVVKASRELSIRLQSMMIGDRRQIEVAYEVLYGREPAEDELQTGLEFLRRQSSDRRWTYFQVLLCANEFMFLE